MLTDVPSRRLVYILVFIWCIFAGSTLQLLVLPLLVPHLHAGDGLLSGGDWVGFHAMALQLHREMLSNGWQAWELRPAGQAPVGIAAAAYYLTGCAKPIILLPLNAALFALSATLFYEILLRNTERRLAWIGLLPFVWFPSALMIYGQFHKDIYSITGFAILLRVLSQLNKDEIDYRIAMESLLLALLGFSLLILVRPYLVDVAIASWWVGFAVMRLTIARAPNQLIFQWRLILLMALMAGIQASSHDFARNSGLSEVTVGPVAHNEASAAYIGVCSRTTRVDRIICSINEVRSLLTVGYPHAASAIDKEIKFESLQDVLMYSPRALQIGLFAPFPEAWLSSQTGSASRLMRQISGIEMAIAYVAMFCLLLAVPMKLFWSAESLAVVSASLCFIIIIVLAIPNIGTLYRMRYAPWSFIVGCGLVAAVLIYQKGIRR